MLSKNEYEEVRQKIENFVQRHNATEPTENVLRAMRSLGLGKVESIKMVNQIFGLDISSAKSLVHSSPIWEDCYRIDEELHDKIEAYVKEL